MKNDLDEQLDRIKRQFEWKVGMPVAPPPIPQAKKTLLDKVIEWVKR